MAWKAKTLAKALMTVALEITFGILSAMTDRFGYAKANIVVRSSKNAVPATLTRRGTSMWKRSIPHAAPHFCRIDGLVRIEFLRLFQQDIGRLRISWIRYTTIIDRTDRRALRFVKMADTLGTPVMGNHVNIVSHSLAVAHMISLRLRVAASFEDGLVRTFWQAGSTVDTFAGNQQCHNHRLLLVNRIELYSVRFTRVDAMSRESGQANACLIQQ